MVLSLKKHWRAQIYCFPPQELEVIVHTFVSSQLDYCNLIFRILSKSSVDHLVQNAAAWLLNRSNRMGRGTLILSSLHWLSIKFRIDFKVLLLTYRALHYQAPGYISVGHLDLLTNVWLLFLELKTKGDQAWLQDCVMLFFCFCFFFLLVQGQHAHTSIKVKICVHQI